MTEDIETCIVLVVFGAIFLFRPMMEQSFVPFIFAFLYFSSALLLLLALRRRHRNDVIQTIIKRLTGR